MSLNYAPPSYAYPQKNGEAITVFGLNFDHLDYLIRRHGDAIDPLFGGEPKVSEIVMKVPALAADIIACAAGEPDAAPVVMRMPAGLQIHLLVEIMKLTFGETDMGNVLRAVLTMIGKADRPTNPDSPTSPAI